jgi:hypothetical protein
MQGTPACRPAPLERALHMKAVRTNVYALAVLVLHSHLLGTAVFPADPKGSCCRNTIRLDHQPYMS